AARELALRGLAQPDPGAWPRVTDRHRAVADRTSARRPRETAHHTAYGAGRADERLPHSQPDAWPYRLPGDLGLRRVVLFHAGHPFLYVLGLTVRGPGNRININVDNFRRGRLGPVGRP